jgi:hypothetical protein
MSIFKRKPPAQTVVANPPTGKARCKQSIYDFRYYIEEELSDGSWQTNEEFPVFNDITEAKKHFEKARKIARTVPADLGKWNDD